jgi:hypothetical protein
MWIVSRKYDLAFIFGGAALSLMIPLLVMHWPELLPIIFWIWLLFFDGTHLYAAYSRTYLDRQFWKTDRALLLASPAVILLPLTAVIFYVRSGNIRPVEYFLVFAQAWAYYHLVRQHYGFVSLYDRKSGASKETHEINKQTIYVGLWTPYIYFLLSHPINRKVAGLPSLFPESELLWGLNIFALFFTGGAAFFFILHYIRKKTITPAAIFTAICMILYSLIFYWIAPMEPFFARAQNVVQSFMILAITMTIFHNIQYHAIVWQFNRKKYGKPEFGLATTLNRNFLIYAIVAVLFAGIYVTTAWLSTDYPSPFGRIADSRFVPVTFCIWWGLLFHHYYLDQKIWRFSKTKDLQQQLNVAV